MDEYPQIGQPIVEGEEPAAYELRIDDHIPFIDPKKYNLSEHSIKPSDYFITSGDAVEKTKVLEKDLWALAGELRRKCYNLIAAENKCTYAKAQNLYRNGIRPKKPAKLKLYENDIWKSAGACRRLLNALLKAKGANIFLETEWNDHKLLCIPKNPRRQQP